MKKLLGRILLFLATGSVSVLIAACYGVPFMYDGGLRPGTIKVTFKDAARGSPIPGLKVLRDRTASPVFSDVGGVVELSTVGIPAAAVAIQALVIDVDGPEASGDYGTVSQSIDLAEGDQEIRLEAK